MGEGLTYFDTIFPVDVWKDRQAGPGGVAKVEILAKEFCRLCDLFQRQPLVWT